MKKVKLNEQGTPNISYEITLSFENGSQNTQVGCNNTILAPMVQKPYDKTILGPML